VLLYVGFFLRLRRITAANATIIAITTTMAAVIRVELGAAAADVDEAVVVVVVEGYSSRK